MIDFFASERQFTDHLAPIWYALDESERGTFFGIRSGAERCQTLGIAFRTSTPGPGDLIAVASIQDLQLVRSRRVIFLEHGAGQRYLGDPTVPAHSSYAGGPEREPVVLFLCPNDDVAGANLATYPDARAEVVGCPKLDRWSDIPPKDFKGDVTVAISFHADLHLCPETYWAYPHYRDSLADLANRFKLIGHGHPRMWSLLDLEYRTFGIEPVKDLAEVFARADLYVSDNSSSLYEFAATGRPVLVLNAPWYRRDIHHGLRFWDKVPGLQCDGPAELPEIIERALADPPEVAQRRQKVVSEVYGLLDGKAAFRAAQAIRSLG